MKRQRHIFPLLAVCLGLVLSLPLTSQATVTHITKVTRIPAPPAGKSLVNIHRTFQGWFRCPIFDESGTFLMDLPEFCEYQQVCEPGQKSFILWFTGGQTQVVTADLAPDKTYDLVIDEFKGKDLKIFNGYRGYLFSPLSMNPRWRNKLKELDQREENKVFTLNRDEVAINIEKAKQERINDIKHDYLGGEKSESVIQMSKDDCR